MDKTDKFGLIFGCLFICVVGLIVIWFVGSVSEQRHKMEVERAEKACQQFKLVLVKDNKVFCQVSPTTVEIRDFE